MTLRSIALTLAAASVLAVAQQGPPRQPGGIGGQFGPGTGMRRPMGPPMGPALLMRPDVQKELKLTEDQIKNVKNLLQPIKMAGPGVPGGPGRGGGQGFGRGPGQQGQSRPGDRGGPAMARRGQGPNGGMWLEQVERKLRKILNADQYGRYRQISLQVQGAPALGRPEVAAKVSLSYDQIDQIHDLIEANRRDRGSMGFGPGARPGRGQAAQGHQGPPDQGQNPQRMREELRNRRAELEEKILGILSSAQRKAWRALLGKPFKLAEPEMRPKIGEGHDG